MKHTIKSVFLGLSLLLTNGSVVYAQDFKKVSEAAANTKTDVFDYAIGAEVRYSTSQPTPQLSYQYSAKRNFSVNFEMDNTGWGFVVTDETSDKQVLDVTFLEAVADGNIFDIDPRASFFIGKHDFDFDGIPELIIGARTLGPESNHADNSLSVNIFALTNNDWVRVGNIDGRLIASGNPRVFIEGNRVKIPRDWRGIVLEWAYESGSFVSVSK
jgi:hypothetical protein